MKEQNGISYSLLKYIKEITDGLVTKSEYAPVRAIVFGMAGLILIGALAALLRLIIK